MFKIVKELCKDFFFRPCDDDQLSDHEPLPDEKEPTNDDDKTRKRKNKRKKKPQEWAEQMEQEQTD